MEDLYYELPEIISYVDSEQSKLFLEIAMLNIETENINLMMNETGFYLSTPADDVHYATTFAFPSPVNPSEAKAHYIDGYLKVEVPFKDPLKDYVKVPVKNDEEEEAEDEDSSSE